MRLRACLFLVCLLATGAAATTASAADHMWMGFQDDPALRWRSDRNEMFDRVQALNASVVRTTVYWSRIAPSRPASPALVKSASRDEPITTSGVAMGRKISTLVEARPRNR